MLMESEGLWKSITWMSNTSTAEPGMLPKDKTQGINEHAHHSTHTQDQQVGLVRNTVTQVLLRLRGSWMLVQLRITYRLQRVEQQQARCLHFYLNPNKTETTGNVSEGGSGTGALLLICRSEAVSLWVYTFWDWLGVGFVLFWFLYSAKMANYIIWFFF